MKNTEKEIVRLDKWLWAARFYKTRSIAQQMIQGGKVRYNGQRTKASRPVELGAILSLRTGFDDTEVVVQQLSGTRRNASFAQTLYQETEVSKEKKAQRKLELQAQPQFDAGHRPDKKQRRERLRAKHTPT